MRRFPNLSMYALLCVAAIGIGSLIAVALGSSRGARLEAVYTPRPAAQSTAAATPGSPATPAAATVTAAPLPSSAAATAAPTQAATRAPVAATAVSTGREPTAAPAAATAAATSASGGFIEYTVQEGDILFKIAQRYHVTIEEILAINDIPDPESLTVGEVIRIPRK